MPAAAAAAAATAAAAASDSVTKRRKKGWMMAAAQNGRSSAGQPHPPPSSIPSIGHYAQRSSAISGAKIALRLSPTCQSVQGFAIVAGEVINPLPFIGAEIKTSPLHIFPLTTFLLAASFPSTIPFFFFGKAAAAVMHGYENRNWVPGRQRRQGERTRPEWVNML